MTAAVEIRNLSKRFDGVIALDDLTLDIPAGITTGLIGPNGSGKTTLLNILTGMLPYDGGDKVMASSRIARTFQDSRLINQISVADNLRLAVAEKRLWNSMLSDGGNVEIGAVLEEIGLAEMRDRNAEELSYGQRKLLDVGRAIIRNADIYFFDEPFTGLFPEIIEYLLQILQRLKNDGKTIVIIEHNMVLIERICDHTIVLDSGRVLAEGSPRDVFKNKQVQEAYLGV